VRNGSSSPPALKTVVIPCYTETEREKTKEREKGDATKIDQRKDLKETVRGHLSNWSFDGM